MSFNSVSKFDEYECSGPRPPVPGGESQSIKMTEGYAYGSGGIGGALARNKAGILTSASSSPAYLKWAQSLSYLLGDREGVALFKRYVEQEGGIHHDRLKFFLACDGLADNRDLDRIKAMIDAIYRFLKRTQMPVPDDVRDAIKAMRRNETEPRADIFDKMYADVKRSLAETTFLNFLKSDIYLDHVRNMTSNSQSGPGLSPASLTTATTAVSTGNSSNANTVGGSAMKIDSNTAASSGGPQPPVTASTLITTSADAANAMVIGSSLGSEQLARSLTLPTLHEDAELVCDNIISLSVSQFTGTNGSSGGPPLNHLPGTSTGPPIAGRPPTAGASSADPPMRLTKDSLLATAQRRLEIRPPGAHGYSCYNNNNYESYNTVSLQDSERQSCSSGLTDSDTASIATSADGRPYIPRRQSSLENRAIRQNAMTNKEVDMATIIPRTNRMHNNQHIPLNPKDLVSALMPKLEAIKKKQDIEELFAKKMHESEPTIAEKAANFQTELRDAIREKLPIEDTTDDQSILDMHVLRVWQDLTPNRSPGTASPGPLATIQRRRTNEYVLQLNYGTSDPREGASGGSSNNSIISGCGISNNTNNMLMSTSGLVNMQQQQQQLRHSRSMPESSHSGRKVLSNKWPSMQTDSGISIFSGDSSIKKDMGTRKHISVGGDAMMPMNTSSQLEEARRRLEDESKRSRRYATMGSGGTSTMIHKSFPPIPASGDCTTVVFSFCDEEFPYRTKIPGKQPTLKQFKEYLPKKGNFRFFFKTLCEDLDNSVIQEEITCDSDILPLYEGKIMALVKPAE